MTDIPFKLEKKPKTKILKIDVFGGKYTNDSEEEIKNYNASDLSNARIDGEKIYKRAGHAVKGTSTGSTTGVLGMYQFHQTGTTDKLMKGYNTVVEYWTGSAWANAITGLTADKDQTYDTFSLQGTTTGVTGTATAGTKYSLTDSGSGWTVDAYRNMFITLDGGTGSGQTKLIVSNTSEVIKVQSPWDTTPSTDTTFTIYNTKPAMIVCNGTDSPRIYDGTAAATKTAIPTGSYVAVHNDRLFIQDDHYLYYSDLFNGEEFPNLNTLPIEPESNAGIGTGIISLGEQLVVCKQHRVYVLTGYYPEQFELIPRSKNIGCIAPKTLVEGNNAVYFLSSRGAERFNTMETNYLDDYFPLSEPISPTLNALSKTDACGGFAEDKYYLSLGTNNSTTFVYDSRTTKKRFTDRTRKSTQPQWLQDTGYTPSCWTTAIESGVEVLYHGDVAKGQAYTHDTGNNDEGAAIAFSWESKNFFLGQEHSLNKMWIHADEAATDGTDFVFQVSVDGGTYQTIATVDMDDVTSAYYEVKLSSKHRGTYMKFKMTNSDSNANVAIQRLEFQLIPDVLR